jgi:hypothetical protein
MRYVIGKDEPANPLLAVFKNGFDLNLKREGIYNSLELHGGGARGIS